MASDDEYYQSMSSHDSVTESVFKLKERFMCIKSYSIEHPMVVVEMSHKKVDKWVRGIITEFPQMKDIQE